MWSRKEAQGYSREAYEYWIKTGGRTPHSSGIQETASQPVNNSSHYLVLLDGPLNTPRCIQEAASLPELPKTIQAASEDNWSAVFCSIDGNVKKSIEKWLSHQKSSFRPIPVRICKVRKDLASDTAYPTLGLETTLPQHRLSSR